MGIFFRFCLTEILNETPYRILDQVIMGLLFNL